MITDIKWNERYDRISMDSPWYAALIRVKIGLMSWYFGVDWGWFLSPVVEVQPGDRWKPQNKGPRAPGVTPALCEALGRPSQAFTLFAADESCHPLLTCFCWTLKQRAREQLCQIPGIHNSFKKSRWKLEISKSSPLAIRKKKQILTDKMETRLHWLGTNHIYDSYSASV